MAIGIADKNSFKWSLLIQISNQLFAFITSILLTRLLTPTDFGLIGMITIFIAIGRALMDGGLGASLIRTKNLDNKDYSTIFLANLVMSFLSYILLFVSAPMVASFFAQPELVSLLRVYGLSIVFSALSTVQSVRFNKSLNFRIQFKLLLPSLIVSGVLAIWFAWTGWGVWAIVIKELIFGCVSTLLLWHYSQWKPKFIFSKEKFNIHFRFGIHLLSDNILSTIFNNLYQVVIGKLFAPAQLGLFTRAKSLGELPNGFVFNAVNRVMFPLLAKKSDDNSNLKVAYQKIVSTVTYFTLPILILMGISATPLFLFLFTEKWNAAIPYFQILILAMILAPIQRYLLNICKVKGRSDLVLKLSIVQYGLTAISLLSIIWLGITGLLWSYVAITFISTLITGFFAGKLINYSLIEQIRDIRGAFGLSLLAGGGSLSILILLKREFLMNSFIELTITTIIFSSIFLFASHLTKHPIYLAGYSYLATKLSRD